jgi:hypothetical protein
MSKTNNDPLKVWIDMFNQNLTPWCPFKSSILNLIECVDEAKTYVETLESMDQNQKKLGIKITELTIDGIDKTLMHFKKECDYLVGTQVPIPQNLQQACLILKNMSAKLTLIYNDSFHKTPVVQDELEVDEDKFSISFNGLTCNLGNTIQFKIFCYLHSHFGKNIRISDLINAVWGDRGIQRNSINKQISLLRNKLSKIKDIVIESNENNTYSMSIKTR